MAKCNDIKDIVVRVADLAGAVEAGLEFYKTITENQTLKALVKEMGVFIRDMAERELLALELHLPNSITIKMSQERADQILSHPEVKAIMEGQNE